MNKSLLFIFSIILICVCCKSDNSALNTDEALLEEDVLLFKIRGTVVGSSGFYYLQINRERTILLFTLDGVTEIIDDTTSFELANSLELSNHFLVFTASIDENGKPHSDVHIPSHNREVATTAIITEVGDSSSQSADFLPTVDPNMAIFEGTIEGKLSVDNGASFRSEIYRESTYNFSINNGILDGHLKCNNCLNDSIYNVSGVLLSSSDTELSLKINTITNRLSSTEFITQPIIENYVRHASGLVLKRDYLQTIGQDSILKNETILTYVE
ncbi:hypothetical protein OAC51_03940 [Flavobacteriaceae bacterium]|nr:hypothetical protein [Flavobacteriaceae bacterium]